MVEHGLHCVFIIQLAQCGKQDMFHRDIFIADGQFIGIPGGLAQ